MEWFIWGHLLTLAPLLLSLPLLCSSPHVEQCVGNSICFLVEFNPTPHPSPRAAWSKQLIPGLESGDRRPGPRAALLFPSPRAVPLRFPLPGTLPPRSFHFSMAGACIPAGLGFVISTYCLGGAQKIYFFKCQKNKRVERHLEVIQVQLSPRQKFPP